MSSGSGSLIPPPLEPFGLPGNLGLLLFSSFFSVFFFRFLEEGVCGLSNDLR